MMICAVIKGPTWLEIHQQVFQAVENADLVELRLDFFADLDTELLTDLKKTFTIPMIFTLPRSSYVKSEEDYFEAICRLVELKPDYIDFESKTSLSIINFVVQKYPEIKVIISEHDFSQTPIDLSSFYRKMKSMPAFMHKLAVQAHSSTDMLRLLCWASKQERPVNVIGMGKYGQASRILGPIMGCSLSYACLDESLQTAPGQLTVEALKELYRYRTLNPLTKIFGLIGDPVDKSISHRTHNHLMKHCGLDAVYVKMEVKETELAEFLQLARKLPFRGLSVTMPLKEVIIPYLDRLDPKAREIGAVNTIHFSNGALVGYNTDGMGALNAIEKVTKVSGKKILVIGAGGSAKAIVYEACSRGASVIVLNRDRERAKKLADQFGCGSGGLDEVKEYDILINTIPVSMPIECEKILPGSVVMDIKVDVKDKQFLVCASERGCRVIDFHRMFVEQAAGQFNIWYGGQLDCVDILEQEALKALQHKGTEKCK